MVAEARRRNYSLQGSTNKSVTPGRVELYPRLPSEDGPDTGPNLKEPRAREKV